MSLIDAPTFISPLQGSERAWPKILAAYRKPRRGRSLFELMVTLIPFVGLWMLAAIAVHRGLRWGIALTIPAAGFLLRLFMIQQDCGHGSFFVHRKADDWTGRAIGVLTFTPYDYWRRAHAAHHSSAGNLDERGVGDITTLTVAEYRSLSRSRRLVYRLYRNPALIGIGSIWLFLLKRRLPFGMMRSGPFTLASSLPESGAITPPDVHSCLYLSVRCRADNGGPIGIIDFKSCPTKGNWLPMVQHLSRFQQRRQLVASLPDGPLLHNDASV